jgi:hypothetical protein
MHSHFLHPFVHDTAACTLPVQAQQEEEGPCIKELCESMKQALWVSTGALGERGGGTGYPRCRMPPPPPDAPTPKAEVRLHPEKAISASDNTYSRETVRVSRRASTVLQVCGIRIMPIRRPRGPEYFFEASIFL